MTASQASKRADSAANSKAMGWLARGGLAARALVYIVLGCQPFSLR